MVNDRQGHGAGDALLRDLTAGWAGRLRRADLLGRYGGDEFVLCLPATDEQGAWGMLEQLASTHHFAWSAGVAAARPGDTLTGVLARADADLYQKKRSGRTPPDAQATAGRRTAASSRRLRAALGLVDGVLVLGARAPVERAAGQAEGEVGDRDVVVELVEAGDGRAHDDLLAVGVYACEP